MIALTCSLSAMLLLLLARLARLLLRLHLLFDLNLHFPCCCCSRLRRRAAAVGRLLLERGLLRLQPRFGLDHLDAGSLRVDQVRGRRHLQLL